MQDSVVKGFLADAGWSGAVSWPVTADMSQRRFTRLVRDDETAILMDARAEPHTVSPFIAMSEWLASLGLSAPGIIAHAPGLLLVEDFGDARLAKRPGGVSGGDYEALLSVLKIIQEAPPVEGLSAPSARALANWIAPISRSEVETQEAVATMAAHLDVVMVSSRCVSLRDFHVENIMWLPDRSGPARYGLIDFQDAFLCHPIYDLVSLLTDARIDVDAPLREKMISLYSREFAQDAADIRYAFDVISVQRNTRILGLFAADAERGGTRLSRCGPRLLNYVSEALENERLGDLKATIMPLIETRLDL